MIRTSTKLENALKYDYSGLSFAKVLRKYRAKVLPKLRVKGKVKGTTPLNSLTKTKLIKNTKVNSIKDLNKSDLLLKQLIDSDFIYSRKSVNKRVPDIVESTLSIKESNLVCTLDIFKLNKSIKQFIKILETLDTFKSEQKIKLYVLCKNKHYLRLIDRMSKKYLLKDIIKLCTILPDLSGKSNKDTTKYLFILGEYEFSRNFFYKLVYYRVSLISKFNLKYERKTSGFYKIQNNLDDYKKLMFLFILIERVLGKKNPVKNMTVKKVKLPVMKNISLKQANKTNGKVENLRKLIKTSKVKLSETSKTNLNKEILVKIGSQVNNLGSVVSKDKTGLVLLKQAKKNLRIKKTALSMPTNPIMKNAALPASFTKNLPRLHNKRLVGGTNSLRTSKTGQLRTSFINSWITRKKKRKEWWRVVNRLSAKKKAANKKLLLANKKTLSTTQISSDNSRTGLIEHSEQRNKSMKKPVYLNKPKKSLKRTDDVDSLSTNPSRTDYVNVNSGNLSTSHVSSNHSRLDYVSKPKGKSKFTKKANPVKVYPTELNPLAPVTFIDQALKANFVKKANGVKKVSPIAFNSAFPTTALNQAPKVTLIKKINSVKEVLKEVYSTEHKPAFPVTDLNQPPKNFIKKGSAREDPRKPYPNPGFSRNKGKNPQPSRK